MTCDGDVTKRVTYVRREEPAVVLFARVDDPAAGPGSDLCGQMPLHVAAEICRWGVRLVCVSRSPAAYIRQVQCELGIVEPFICDGGAAVHVPNRYVAATEPLDHRVECKFEIFRFSPPDRAAAVTLVRDLFVANCRGEPVTIGIGCDCDDYGVLAVVDIPIVVRDAVNDQSMLMRHIPGVYVTSATGSEGWAEALRGP